MPFGEVLFWLLLMFCLGLAVGFQCGETVWQERRKRVVDKVWAELEAENEEAIEAH